MSLLLELWAKIGGGVGREPVRYRTNVRISRSDSRANSMIAANRKRLTGCAVLILAVWVVQLSRPVARGQALPSTTPPEGLRENTPAIHALVNAKLVLAPGRVIERGTLVVREGVIVAIGATGDVAPPADARVWDLTGKTVYPGLIDAYGEVSEAPQARTGPGTGPELIRTTGGSGGGAASGGGASHWNPRVTPQVNMAEQYRPDADTNKRLRGQGV